MHQNAFNRIFIIPNSSAGGKLGEGQGNCEMNSSCAPLVHVKTRSIQRMLSSENFGGMERIRTATRGERAKN